MSTCFNKTPSHSLAYFSSFFHLIHPCQIFTRLHTAIIILRGPVSSRSLCTAGFNLPSCFDLLYECLTTEPITLSVIVAHKWSTAHTNSSHVPLPLLRSTLDARIAMFYDACNNAQNGLLIAYTLHASAAALAGNPWFSRSPFGNVISAHIVIVDSTCAEAVHGCIRFCFACKFGQAVPVTRSHQASNVCFEYAHNQPSAFISPCATKPLYLDSLVASRS